MYQLPKNELHEAYWIYTHRLLLKKIGYVVAGVTAGTIWIVLIFSIAVYISGMSSARRATESIAETTVLYQNRNAVQPLQILSSRAVESSADTIDAYLEVKNPNLFSTANFNYSILLDGKKMSMTNAQIMPNSQAYFVITNITAATLPSTVQGVIDETSWSRVNTTLIKQLDFELMNKELSAVKVANANQSPNSSIKETNTPKSVVNSAASTNDPGTYPFTKLTATLKNKTVVGFKTIRIVAIIRQSTTILGIKELSLHDVASYSETPIELYWQRRFAANADSEILIYGDYLNRDNLIYPGEQ